MKPLFALVAIISLHSPSAQTQPGEAPVPIRSFFEPSLGRSSLSDDGKRFAYGMREGNELFLYVVDLETGERAREKVGEDAPLPFDDRQIVRPASMSFLAWKGNERIIYKPNGYQIFAIDPDFQNKIELVRFRNENNSGPDNHFSAFRSVRNMLAHTPDKILIEARATVSEYSVSGGFSYGSKRDIYTVDVNSGQMVSHGGIHGTSHTMFHDAWGVVRAEIRQQSSSRYDLFVFAPDSEELQPIAEVIGDELVEKYNFNYDYKKGIGDFLNRPTILPFGFNPEIMFFASAHDRDTLAIYAINLRKREVEGPLAENAQYDIIPPNSVFNYSSLTHSFVTKSLVGMTAYLERPTAFWINPDFKSAQDAIDALRPKLVNYIGSWSNDLQRFSVLSYGDDYHYQLAVFDRPSGRLLPIVESPQGNAITVPARIPSPLGHEIPCYLTLPKTVKPGQPNRTVVLLHGGPWTRDYWYPDDEVRLLADRGYSVLRINFRGSKGFGKDYTMAARDQYGEAALEDVMTVLQWAVQNKISEPGNIVAMGGSYGGYLALLASAMYPDVFDRTIAIAPVTDLARTIKEQRFDSASDWRAYLFLKEMIGDPKKDRARLKNASPLQLSENYENPVLLIHGLDDSVVPYEHSAALFRKIRKQSPEHKYLSIKHAGHGGWSPEQIDEIYGAILAFAAKNNN